MRRIKLLSIGTVALLAAGVLAACGGSSGGGSGEDPQQVLNETFGGDSEPVKSGIIEFIFNASGQTGGGDASVNVAFGGPFQDQGEGQFPAFDFSFDFAVNSPDQDQSFAGAATSTGAKGFVTFMGTTYEVDGPIFDQFTQGFLQSAAGADAGSGDTSAQLEMLGIDPSGWLTNLQNEGNEDVEGTETIHISGDANIPQIVEDIQSAASTVGNQGPPIPTEQLGQFEDAITEAKIDVFTGADDRVLRRLALTFAIDLPADVDGGGSANVDFSVTLSQLNEAQTIQEPTDTQPLSELLSQFGLLGPGGGLGPLGNLGLTPGTGTGDSAPAPPDVPEVPEAAPGEVPPLPEGGEEYLDCIAGASSPSDLQECAELLSQ